MRDELVGAHRRPIIWVVEFILHRPEEALTRRIIRGAPFFAHRPHVAVFRHPLDPGGDPIVEPPVAVDDHSGIAGKLVRLVEHVRRQQRIRRLSDRPVDRASREAIYHRGKVDLPVPKREFGDVGQRFLKRLLRLEIAFDHVFRRRGNLPHVR